jgi:predicted nucleic acid-binding protein
VFTAVVSPSVLVEYAEVLERLRQRYPDRPWVDWVSALRDDAELVFPAIRMPGAFADPDDALVAECAVTAEVDYIVSGDKRHLQSAVEIRGIPILSPARFLQVVQSDVG